MSDSALCEIFDALDSRETRNARRWLESALPERRREPLLLFDYLASCRAAQRTAEWQKANEAVFNDPNGDLARLRHTMSELSALLRDFFIWLELRQEPGQQELLLLRALRKRGLEKNFRLAGKEAEKHCKSRDNALSSIN